jgi:RNA polymerase sigma-70 factor (ECF subfamily)
VRFEGRLFNFLLRRVASRVDAEDLTQEAFVRSWERIASYDPTWRFSTWLFTIASRLAVSEHRRRRPMLVIESAEQVGRCDADLASAEQSQHGGSRLWALAQVVLREDQHTALWLRYAEDMTIGEIAKVMGKTHVGVRVALFRARQTLAQAARGSGLGESDDMGLKGEQP